MEDGDKTYHHGNRRHRRRQKSHESGDSETEEGKHKHISDNVLRNSERMKSCSRSLCAQGQNCNNFDKRGRCIHEQPDAFCKCVCESTKDTASGGPIFINDCSCAVSNPSFSWLWDAENAKQSGESSVFLSNEKKMVIFHMNYSRGTAAIKGDTFMTEGQHFWEIKMMSSVYGTDMMVGVGTEKSKTDGYESSFVSLLGNDCESWGYSYLGYLKHDRMEHRYGVGFGQGSIIGIHLDLWHGTLSFFKNRYPLGTAFVNLQGLNLCPMAMSTAARSAMKIVQSQSSLTTLFYFCCTRIRRCFSPESDCLELLKSYLPPGLYKLLKEKYYWIFHKSCIFKDDIASPRKRSNTLRNEDISFTPETKKNRKVDEIFDSDEETGS